MEQAKRGIGADHSAPSGRGAHADARSRTTAAGIQAASEADRLRRENYELRSLLARCHAELMEAKLAAGHATAAQPVVPEGAIRMLGEQLKAAAEALAQANSGFRAEAGRVAELTRELAERDEAIRRQDLLNREIDHRIKNSLQDVISLLRIQATRETAPGIRAFAEKACTRLEALAVTHELLHATGSLDRLDFGVHLERLCACLRRSVAVDGQHRNLILEATPVILPCEAAKALALAVNELVTNAFRHAFRPGEPGTVWVQLHRHDGTMQLSVADDGRGLPRDEDVTSGGGFGLRLVKMLASQVGARIAVTSRTGTRITLVMPTDRQSEAG